MNEIEQLESKIAMWKRINNPLLEKQIEEAEAKIQELKQQQNNNKDNKDTFTKVDIDKAFTKDTITKEKVVAQKRADANSTSLGENEVDEEEVGENEEYEDMILCTDQPLIKGTTGKQFNSYSYGVKLGYVDKERVNGEMNKYLRAEDIEGRRQELLDEGIKVPSKRTLENDFKFLSKLGYVNIINSRENGVCYQLKQSMDGKYFANIPLYKWKELVISTNRNMLKLFTVISIKCNCYDYEQITHEYLCICMDIEPTDGNQKYISTMVNSLRKLGMIDIQQETDIIYSEEAGKKLVKRHNYYRLTTKEEYNEINKRPIKKNKK